MFQYILKRLLLMIPTFLGATFLVFVIISYVPGGPFDQAVQQIKMGNLQSGESGGGGGGGMSDGKFDLTPEQLDQLRRQYGLDKPVPVRYLIWLGLYPRITAEKKVELGEKFRENTRQIVHEGYTFNLQRWIRAEEQNGEIVVLESPKGLDFNPPASYEGKYKNAPELPNYTAFADSDWRKNDEWKFLEKTDKGEFVIQQTAFSGIFTGDLGISNKYDKPVITLIKERLHISAYFGIIGFVLTYLICIPLGISKAVRHNTTYDFFTSALIFLGYATPGFALGALLLVVFGGGNCGSCESVPGWCAVCDLFPLGGFRSSNFEELSFFGKIKDQLHHTILPVICYMISSFATLTLLMKNSLLENLNQDYVRTAFAKGLDENKVIYKHAVRNSLIPIATGLGGAIGIFLAGSYFIEYVFNIDGIGLLSYNAIVMRDYPVFLGFLVISIVVLLIGNLISDLLYVSIDPRIKLH